MKQRNVVNLSYEWLSEQIGLDNQHEVIDIIYGEQDQYKQRIGVVVAGPKCTMVPEGSVLSWVALDYLREQINE